MLVKINAHVVNTDQIIFISPEEKTLTEGRGSCKLQMTNQNVMTIDSSVDQVHEAIRSAESKNDVPKATGILLAKKVLAFDELDGFDKECGWTQLMNMARAFVEGAVR